MAETLKVLGQVAPGAAAEASLYLVPAGCSAVSSTLMVCNRGAGTASINVGVSVGGGALAAADYLYYSLAVPSHDTFAATIGITLAAADDVRVYSSTVDVSFSLFGTEVS